MMHRSRRWGLAPVSSAEELARMLTEHTWTPCSGFFVTGHERYLFLNDSTSPDGAQEYAMVRRSAVEGSPMIQIESITFGWCSYEQALGYVREALSGSMDASAFAHPVRPGLDEPGTHGTCGHCA